MILVTLGTQDKSFHRLLENIDDMIKNGEINEDVIVQAGSTRYHSPNMRILDFVDRDVFEKLISECDVLITHGGVGSILSGVQNKKKVIAVARLAKYDEHENDHQIQIVNKFSEAGFIVGCFDANTLSICYKSLETFQRKDYVHNNNKMLTIINEFIQSV